MRENLNLSKKIKNKSELNTSINKVIKDFVNDNDQIIAQNLSLNLKFQVFFLQEISIITLHIIQLILISLD